MNPYRYDGRDRVLADPADGLDWLATRAYDASTGRFLARDPLGRAPLFFADNPYAYAGNNPVSNVDPTGQYRAAGHGAVARESGAATNKMMARVVAWHGTPSKGGGGSVGCGGCKVKEGVATLAQSTETNCDATCKVHRAQLDASGAVSSIDNITKALGTAAGLLGIFLFMMKQDASDGPNPLYIRTAALVAVLAAITGDLTLESAAFGWEAQQGASFWLNTTWFLLASESILAIGPVITALIGAAWALMLGINIEDPVFEIISFVVGLFAEIGALIGSIVDELIAVNTIDLESRDLGY